jgi:hypothetical protein
LEREEGGGGVEAPAAEVGGAVAAVAPYIDAAATVPHGGSKLPPWSTAVATYHRGPRRALPLPSWPTAVGCTLAPLLAADRCRPLAAVGHGGCLSNRHGAQKI